MRHLWRSVLLLAIAIPATFVSQARANPAAAYPQSACTISGFGGFYQGSGTVVFRDGALVLTSCEAQLLSGVRVAQTTRVSSGNCNEVFTPSGEANLACAKS